MDLKKELRIIVKYMLPKEAHDKDVIENYVDTLALINEEYVNQLMLSSVISRLSMQEVLNYEIHSHWFASWIGFEWGQNVMGTYFAWKVRRKYNRYLVSLEEQKRVLNGC